MIEYFIKLNKYQKGIIISLLILSLSLIGFMFNSRVRLGVPQDKVPDIIIEESKDTDSKEYPINELMFMLVFMTPVIILALKVLGDMLDD